MAACSETGIAVNAPPHSSAAITVGAGPSTGTSASSAAAITASMVTSSVPGRRSTNRPASQLPSSPAAP